MINDPRDIPVWIPRMFPVVQGKVFSIILAIEDNLARRHQIFKTPLSGIFALFDFLSGIFKWMARISEMQQFLAYGCFTNKESYVGNDKRALWNYGNWRSRRMCLEEWLSPLRLKHKHTFFCMNLFYKNVEAEKYQNFKNVLKTFLGLRVD